VLLGVGARACSKITSGMDVLRKLELLETRQEGIFVMPKEVRVLVCGVLACLTESRVLATAARRIGHSCQPDTRSRV
jgi:hypothetical protein